MTATRNPGSGQKQSSSSSSRFASLRVFKFAAGSPKNSPPIPPPKDNAPTNSSWVSLTSDPSTPVTPVSPDYTRSQSTPPFFTAQSPALSSQDPTSASSSTSFGKGLIKFAKRSLTPKPATRQLSESSEDSSISLPWNFQHNLHVDEGYNGLPPSWSASLASLGYSEEEIEAITYRRATSRAPSTVPFQHPNFPDLPSTSQLSIITTTTQNAGDRATPSPSIRRQPSQVEAELLPVVIWERQCRGPFVRDGRSSSTITHQPGDGLERSQTQEVHRNPRLQLYGSEWTGAKSNHESKATA
ncbi:hypothetical protein BDM02DRAFT_3113394 [Thelephora ganbajun]|uniref:Uncharacterized protein n=1 Tax=Thelephora ganbajun TaxID=370292 RepID=A0ACB6ZJF8_THEGA|nr:hypothetical protein BDM02DRAFT_3113394 [Thelephora ganbajun]